MNKNYKTVLKLYERHKFITLYNEGKRKQQLNIFGSRHVIL